MRQFVLLLACILLSSNVALAQQKLTAAEVVKLKQAGLSDAEVIAELKRTGTQLVMNTTLEAQLRKAKAGKALIDHLWSSNSAKPGVMPAGPQGAVPGWPTRFAAGAAPGAKPGRKVLVVDSIDEVIRQHQQRTPTMRLLEAIAAGMQAGLTPAERQRLDAANLPLSVIALLSGKPIDDAALDAMLADKTPEPALELVLRSRSCSVVVEGARALDLMRKGLPPALARRIREGEFKRVGGAGPAPSPNPGQPLASFGTRFRPAKDPVVARALAWLAAYQGRSGAWSPAWDASGAVTGRGRGHARLKWIAPGVSGLALLAFLSDGHTHLSGKHKDTVKRGLVYLLTEQQASGLIGSKRGHYMYNHLVGTLALVEAYAMTRDPALEARTRLALDYVVRAANPGMGWRYGERDGDNDVSVSGWAVMALQTARLANLGSAAQDKALSDAIRFMASVTDDSFFVSGYKTRPPRGWQGPTSSRFANDEMGVNTANSHAPNHTPTAIVIASRSLANQPLQAAAVAHLMKPAMLPSWDAGGGGKLSKIDTYYWFHAARAIHHVGDARMRKVWRDALRQALDKTQRSDGALVGSWDSEPDAWGVLGGRVYTTAMATLCLLTERRCELPKGDRIKIDPVIIDAKRLGEELGKGTRAIALMDLIQTSEKEVRPSSSQRKSLVKQGLPYSVELLLLGKQLTTRDCSELIKRGVKVDEVKRLLVDLGCRKLSARDVKLLEVLVPRRGSWWKPLLQELRKGTHNHKPRKGARGGA